MSDEFFEPTAFSSLTLLCVFDNSVTGQTLQEGVSVLEIQDVGDLKLTLSLPPKSVAMGNTGALEIYAGQGSVIPEKPILKVTGKCETVELQPDQTLRVQFDLYQVDEPGWRAFLNLFQKRQDEILKLFEAQR